MNVDEVWADGFQQCLTAVMYGTAQEEIDAVCKAVAFAVDRRWIGTAAATRAGRLLAAGLALEAAQLLVPAGWSVAIAAVDPHVGPGDDTQYVREFGGSEHALPPAAAGVVYVAQSAPAGIPTDPMAIRFGPEDSCHLPDHSCKTAALALCGEAMMLQFNLEEVGWMSLH